MKYKYRIGTQVKHLTLGIEGKIIDRQTKPTDEIFYRIKPNNPRIKIITALENNIKEQNDTIQSEDTLF